MAWAEHRIQTLKLIDGTDYLVHKVMHQVPHLASLWGITAHELQMKFLGVFEKLAFLEELEERAYNHGNEA